MTETKRLRIPPPPSAAQRPPTTSPAPVVEAVEKVKGPAKTPPTWPPTPGSKKDRAAKAFRPFNIERALVTADALLDPEAPLPSRNDLNSAVIALATAVRTGVLEDEVEVEP